MEEINKEKSKKKKIIAIIAAILVIAAVIGFFIYNNAITAVTMRIQRLVGTVNLFNEEGAEQALREQMRLGAGQTVTTAGESLIMVSLDDTKLMTMEETSKAEIQTRGKKLLFKLLEGNLFFNVTEKLSEDESFDVQTSTMVCGIRGTSAYVGRDSTSHEILMVTDGIVHVVATNPVTKETTEVDVPAGQMITIYLDDEAEGNKTISIVMQSFREEDLPALALDTMRKNKALMARVAKATGFSAKKLATLADLSSKKGISMYGAAANDFKSEGVDDAIPFMGYRAKEMTTSANSAVDIAKDDLPLEVAIIQGYRDVMDAGDGAGYNRDNLGTLMKGTRYCFEETFKRVELSGMRGTDRLNVAIRVSDTLKVSAGRMVTSKLTTKEINDVMEATTLLFTEAVEEAAGPTSDGSKANEILAAVGRVSDHVTGTVDEEMNKSSNGEETVIALLANGSGTGRKSSAAASEPEKEDEKTPDTKREEGGANGGEAGNAAGAAENKSAGNASNGGSSKGGATKQELAAAQAAIVATDASTGIVALADGTLFDPTYYAAANPDVVAQYGTGTNALLAEWLKEGKAQGRPPIAPTVVANNNTTESKPDWLLRQEAEERAKSSSSSDDDDDDDDSSSSNSGGGGGGGGSTVQLDGNYNGTLPNGTEINASGGLKVRSSSNNKTINLPVTVEYGGQTQTVTSITGVDLNGTADGTVVTGVSDNANGIMSAVNNARFNPGTSNYPNVSVSNGTTTVSMNNSREATATVSTGSAANLDEFRGLFNNNQNKTNSILKYGNNVAYDNVASKPNLRLTTSAGTKFYDDYQEPAVEAGTGRTYITVNDGNTQNPNYVNYYVNPDGSVTTT